jgi:hypothetical protein
MPVLHRVSYPESLSENLLELISREISTDEARYLTGFSKIAIETDNSNLLSSPACHLPVFQRPVA